MSSLQLAIVTTWATAIRGAVGHGEGDAAKQRTRELFQRLRETGLFL